MPHDLPHGSTVYHYFRKWQKERVWERAAQALVRRDRERERRYASPSALVVDSQSVKTTEKGAPRGRQSQEGEGAETPGGGGYRGRMLRAYVYQANVHDQYCRP